jgi:hypothetical protein
MARDLAPSPTVSTTSPPASAPSELLNLGIQLGRELGRVGSEATFGSVLVDKVPELFEMGSQGLEIVKMMIKERRETREQRARERAAATTTGGTDG